MANLFADNGLCVPCIMCMQILAANDSAAFESRASKFLVTNRTLSYSAQVSGTPFCTTVYCRTWVVCHGPKTSEALMDSCSHVYMVPTGPEKS